MTANPSPGSLVLSVLGVPPRQLGRARLALLCLVLTLAAVGLLARVSVERVGELKDEANSIARAYEVLHAFDALKLARSEQNTDYQLFIYSADRQALTAFERATSRVDGHWMELRAALRGVAAGSAAELEGAQAAQTHFMSTGMELRGSKGEHAARRHELLSEDRLLSQRIDEGIERLASLERSAMETLQQRREMSTHQILWGSCALLTALIASFAWLYWSIRRSERNGRATLASLAASEARFRKLIALSADWYWEQDEALRISFISSEANSKGGCNVASLLGQMPWDAAGVDLESADWEEHKRTCNAHLPFRDFIYRRIGDDGTAHWISINGEPLFDAKGTFLGYRGVASD